MCKLGAGTTKASSGANAVLVIGADWKYSSDQTGFVDGAAWLPYPVAAARSFVQAGLTLDGYLINQCKVVRLEEVPMALIVQKLADPVGYCRPLATLPNAVEIG